MQYVICYDVADDARRNRLAESLLDFGRRIQESVFIANLDEELAGRMRQKIEKSVDSNLDTVHIFSLCRACSDKTQIIGLAQIPVDKDFYIV